MTLAHLPESDLCCRFFKTPDGVKIQELALGAGREAKPGDRVVVDYVLRSASQHTHSMTQRSSRGTLRVPQIADQDCASLLALIKPVVFQSLVSCYMQAIKWVLHLCNCGGGVFSASRCPHWSIGSQSGDHLQRQYLSSYSCC